MEDIIERLKKLTLHLIDIENDGNFKLIERIRGNIDYFLEKIEFSIAEIEFNEENVPTDAKMWILICYHLNKKLNYFLTKLLYFYSEHGNGNIWPFYYWPHTVMLWHCWHSGVIITYHKLHDTVFSTSNNSVSDNGNVEHYANKLRIISINVNGNMVDTFIGKCPINIPGVLLFKYKIGETIDVSKYIHDNILGIKYYTSMRPFKYYWIDPTDPTYTGEYVNYCINGVKLLEGNYLNGNKNGHFIERNTDGKIISELDFENNVVIKIY